METVAVNHGYDTYFGSGLVMGYASVKRVWFKEQNTLLRALRACTRVTKSPRVVVFCSYSNMVPLSDNVIKKKTLSSNGICLGGLLVRAFGE